MALPAEKSRYSFADFLAWDEHERAEIIGGEIYLMGTPSSRHQEISFEIGRQLGNYLEGKRCRDDPEAVDTVVEPDISVICDRGKIDKTGCKGAPDMVVEILSPSTQRHDRLVKLGLYQRAGVREYWIVSPEEQTVQVMLLDSGGVLQLHEVYDRDSIAKVNILDGCFIELAKVFAE